MLKKFACILLTIMMISLTGCQSRNIDNNTSETTPIITQTVPSEQTTLAPENPLPDEPVILPQTVPIESSLDEVAPSTQSTTSPNNATNPPPNKPTSTTKKTPATTTAKKNSITLPTTTTKNFAVGSSATADPSTTSTSETPSTTTPPSVSPVGEMKAVWISYLDLASVISKQSQAGFTNNIDQMFSNAATFGFNTVIVQVRPFGDALYSSSYFPWSYSLTGTEGNSPGYDPLSIMINSAHSKGLLIEAWVNPYRIRSAGNSNTMSSTNQAKKWLDAGSNNVMNYKGVTSYNPASAEARTLIVNGIKEIVQNYNVDGIHIDDYFYPTTDRDFDKTSYAQSGTNMALADWRRENVNILVRDIYSSIKAIKSSVKFGISPQGNMENNYNSQFIDVKKWLSNPGYLDYICPQIYFGFDNSSYPFTSTVKMWNDMITTSNISLYIGMAPYKLGGNDEWAGNGKNEWRSTTNILARMVNESRKHAKYSGFSMYRYDSLFNPSSTVKSQVDKEKENLAAVIK